MSERIIANRVCVLGGAFNPPTVAHRELLLAGMRRVNAERGVFLPANGVYVREKLADGDFSFSDSDRLRMLNCLCARDCRLSVDDREMRTDGRAYTYDTLKSIERDMPFSEIYFVIGADKLRSLSRWYKSAELRREFRIIAAGRAGDRAEIPDGIMYITLDKALSGISASAFRALFMSGDAERARGMVSPESWSVITESRCDLTGGSKTYTIDDIVKHKEIHS